MSEILLPVANGALRPVRTLGDIDFLVKENEIMTGSAGRTFVVMGLRDEACRIALQPCGYVIEPLDEREESTGAHYVSAADWPCHAVVRALRAGLLFTHEVG